MMKLIKVFLFIVALFLNCGLVRADFPLNKKGKVLAVFAVLNTLGCVAFLSEISRNENGRNLVAFELGKAMGKLKDVEQINNTLSSEKKAEIGALARKADASIDDILYGMNLGIGGAIIGLMTYLGYFGYKWKTHTFQNKI